MLGSTLVGYNYGVAGPYWFAAGCSPMIVFFALLGISCKLKIPEAHTLLEIVRIRYGTVAHCVFMFLCVVNNLFAVANMLLGASAAITALTGMHIIAATFLLPIGVVLYTFVGGIKATFLTDYIHTFIILVIACFFTIKAFTVPEIGSPGGLYDLVVAAGKSHPVEGNHDGSYMTMASKNGILFGIIHICANFGLVIMDTGYFVKAFSASPAAVVPGYVIGGIAYFAIPWGLGTLMSFVALGLETNPIFPTYPRRMTTTEISNGLVLPYAAIAIAGKGGAAAVLLITFMAVTSTLSAQVIAVSSIISFDMYRTYFNRLATDADVIRWSHYGVVIFAIIAAAFSTMLHYVGVDLSWTLYMLGTSIQPVFPRSTVKNHITGILQTDAFPRRNNLSRDLPNGLYHPLAPAIQSSSYHLPNPRHDHRPCCMARICLCLLWLRYDCHIRRNFAMRLWNSCFCLFASSLFTPHHSHQASELRLGRIRQGETLISDKIRHKRLGCG